MASPIIAAISRAPGAQALARVAAIAGRADAIVAAAPPAAAPAGPAATLGPGLAEALPAGYRNLAVPLGEASALAAESTLAAAYGPSEAELAELPRLAGARLPLEIVAREAQAAARALAEARGETLERLLEDAPVMRAEKLPSGNAADAEATLRTALLVRDGARDTATIDIYLAKTGPGLFEATSYDRDFAGPSGAFPYAAPPLSVDRLQFDAACASLVALMTGRPLALALAQEESSPLGLLAIVAASTLLAVVLALSAGRPATAAVAAGVGLGALAYALLGRKRPSPAPGGGDALRPSSR